MKFFLNWSVVGWGGLILAFSSLFSRVLGVLRDVTFSRIFGAGEQGGIFALDAYYTAFKIPDLLYTLLITGALSAAFIPLYSGLLKKDSERAYLFASQVMNGLLFLLLVLSALAWFFAPSLIPLLAPGFSDELLQTTVQLTRIMLLSPLFMGLSSVFQGVGNSHKKFYGMATAPLVYNLSILFSALFFGSTHGVYALAYGVLLGALLHLLVQVPELWFSGFHYRFNWDLRSQEIWDFIQLALPRLFGLAATQLSTLVDTMLASLLMLGSLSVFNYALNLQSLPYGVVAISLSVAVFASLSEKMDDRKGFLETLKKSQHAILFWVLPALLGLFVLRREVVDLVLLGGDFTPGAAEMTTLTLGIFIWAALGQSLTPLYARAFYALKETRIPVLIGFFSVALNIACSVFLIQVLYLQVWALAVSAVLSASVNAILLMFFLRARLRAWPSEVMEPLLFGKTLLAAGAMVGVLYLLQQLTFDSLVFEVLILVSAGAGTYLALAKFMKIIPSLRES